MRKLFLILCLFTVACDSGSDRYAPPAMAPQPAKEMAASDGSATSDAPEGAEAPVARPSKIIRNADLAIEVGDLTESMAAIGKMAIANGGMVSHSSTQNQEEGVLYGYLTLRVPSDKLDLLLADVRKTAVRVERENIYAQDVTKQYYDVEARLANKRKLEERLVQILERAKSVEEVLQVEVQLASVRETIEQLDASLKSMSEQVSYSTVSISLSTGSRGNFAGRLVRAFREGFRGFLDTVVGLITFVIAGFPAFLFIGVLIYFFLRWRKKRKARKLEIPPSSKPI